VRSGSTVAAAAYLDKGVDPSTCDVTGLTALMLVAGRGCLEMVKLLVERGIPVDDREARKGLTAHHFACSGGHPAVTAYLLERGAAAANRGNLGRTAVMFAAGKGDVASLRLLIGQGADLDCRNAYGNTAVTIAEDMERPEVRAMLLAAGGEPADGIIGAALIRSKCLRILPATVV
jgi:ankyrin repeat protein